MQIIRALLGLYSLRLPFYLHIAYLEIKQVSAYYKWFINTTDFKSYTSNKRSNFQLSFVVIALYSIGLINLLIGAYLIYKGLQGTVTGGVWFGLAVILAVPLLMALIVPFLNILGRIVNALQPKRFGKAVLCVILEHQVKQLRRKYQFKVIAVGGSVGKTSTKLAIAQSLQATGLKVRYQAGNYNDRLTVPLVVFDQSLPKLFNGFAWLNIIIANRRTIRSGYPFEIVVVELGTDGPGQMKHFNYLQPDIGIITAVAAEHMEQFGNLEAVANEEMVLAGFSKQLLVNADDVPQQYRLSNKYITYGLHSKKLDYYAISGQETIYGQTISIQGKDMYKTKIAFLGPQGRKVVLAAAVVADKLQLSNTLTAKALSSLKPFAGRMQILTGKNGTTIIDDTYNATPTAVKAALTVLETTKAPQRIAVLGSMNELGDYSVEAHQSIGAAINSDNVDMVVTVGGLARDYLAPAAQANGCRVKSFDSPVEAGKYVAKVAQKQAIILYKGSQNGVFCEEAIKPMLLNLGDYTRLVRQTPSWMSLKRRQFNLPV